MIHILRRRIPSRRYNPNKVSLDIYKKSQSDGKLAVWMFAMPSENEHTGDCILLRSPKGKIMLIDTGSKQGGELVDGYLTKLGINKIDVLVISHMHSDHVGGVASIIAEREVGEVYGSPLRDYQSIASRTFYYRASQKKNQIQCAVCRHGNQI